MSLRSVLRDLEQKCRECRCVHTLGFNHVGRNSGVEDWQYILTSPSIGNSIE